MTTLVPVLLAGGSGTRLWPTSRKSYPKQFVDLTGSGDSFLQSSLKRSAVMPNACPWIIVTGEDYRFLVAQQAKEADVSIGPILLEPSARNTAPVAQRRPALWVSMCSAVGRGIRSLMAQHPCVCGVWC